MKFRPALLAPGATLLALVLGFTSASQAADWPQTYRDIKGTHTLDQVPQRIVSTSVTLTGALLALGAPVVASGATAPGNRIADDQGYLRQWGEIAKKQKLARLYIGEANAEAVAAQMPDLILVSATGGDSALRIYDQLAAIAPVMVVNYDDKSWQEVLTQLGKVTGKEAEAAARIASFNTRLAQVKANITLPPQPINALVYTPAAHSANLWTSESAQGQLLKQLGFDLAPLPPHLTTGSSMGKRHDIIQLAGENLAKGLNGQSILLFANGEKEAQALQADPVLAPLPAVTGQRVWALGSDTFRLDYYSASLVLERIEARFKKS